MTTTSTNQALLRPTPQTVKKGKSKRTSPAESQRKKAKLEAAKPLLHRNESSASSSASARSGLVDLVVTDTRAEETARVRARKEGGPGWNEAEPKRYIRQYPPEVAGEEIKTGFEPPATPPVDAPTTPHATQGGPESSRFSIGDVGDEEEEGEGGGKDRSPVMPKEDSPWRSDDDARGGAVGGDSTRDFAEIYENLNEQNVWGNH